MALRESAVAVAMLAAFSFALVLEAFYLDQSMYAIGVFAVAMILVVAVRVPLRIPHAPTIAMTSVVLILDNPGERPFPTLEPVTTIIGTWFFQPLQRLTDVPIPISAYELAAVIFGGYALIRIFRRYLLGQADVSWVGCAAPLMLMTAWGMFLGIARGGDIIDAIFQARSLPFFFLWGVAAWEYFRHEDQLWAHFITIGACATLKALQGIAVWYFAYHAGARDYRYVIDHFYSDAFMHTAILAVALLMLPSKKPLPLRMLFSVSVFAIVIFAAYINNRRTAYLGVAFSLPLIPVILAPNFCKRYIKIFAWALVAAGTCGAFMILRKAYIGTGSASITDDSAFYRVQENLNLLELVREHPILGAGFGKPMPLLHEMASVADAYKQFALVPHNNMLFIWAFIGPLGIALFASYCQQALAICVRYATDIRVGMSQANMRSKIIAFLVASQVIRWMLYVYADLGLILNRFIYLVPISVAALTRIYTLQRQKETGGIT